MKEDVQQLFKKGKILARAMDKPDMVMDFNSLERSYDFSIWANEYEKAKLKGLGSLSTTLLVEGEKIPTYKAIGFLINSNKADIRHVAESDSGSKGTEEDGTFSANETDIHSLEELEATIKNKHSRCMNEVNINMRENAYVGLFANKSQAQLPNILLAQKYYELQTGINLPIFIYDYENGELEEFDISLEEKANIVRNAINNKKLNSAKFFYETENGDYKKADYLEEISKEIKSRNSMQKRGIDAINQSNRAGLVMEEYQNLKMICKNNTIEKSEQQNEDIEK